MTARPRNPRAGHASGADPTLLALAHTQRAVVQLAKHLKINLNDENQRNSAPPHQNAPGAAANRASVLSAWEKAAALYPARPRITPQYVQEALNAYHEIDNLLTSPE